MLHNGIVKKIPEGLAEILNEKEWIRVKACIVLGKITKVLLQMVQKEKVETYSNQ